MVDILKDHMPFSLWIPFFSKGRVGFVDVNGLTNSQSWPAAEQQLPVIREPLTSRTEEEPTGKQRQSKRKQPEYRDASDSDDLDKGGDDGDAVVSDEESDDSSEDDEEEEPQKKLNKDASKEAGGPNRRGPGKPKWEKEEARLKNVHASRRHEKGRKSKVYLKSLDGIINQLNHPAKFEIVTGHDFGELLKRAGAFHDGEIVVRIKSILSEQDEGNYFGSRREK